uniref:CDC42 effector protein 4 n=1 Tax=Callithrix jacchus TaxID=9483 RepID=A0A8I4A0M5_CALJA
MPILKQLVSSSVHSKRRSRVDLTAEMISAPLGDFRHTMHVGRAGDAFGDTSFLNSKASEKGTSKLPKSLSSSPVKKANGGEGGDEAGVEEAVPRRNGAMGLHSPDPLLDEQAFGDLADLPVMPKASYGLKHAESIMSFHIDLGPSMLGDVLSIMDKEEWDPEEEEGSYHCDEGTAGTITQAPPYTMAATPLARQEDKAGPDLPSLPSHALEDEGWAAAAPSPGSARSVGSHTTRDSSSLSSCPSGVLEERSPAFRGPDRARAAVSRQPDKEFSFMDEEEEDEIRV